MLTDEIRNVNAATGQIMGFQPHIMFYAPNLTNEDVGAPQPRDPSQPWMPFVAYQGPQGFVIVVVGEAESGG